MQTMQPPGQSSTRYVEDPWSVELSIRDAREQTASRHDAQMLTARAVPVDPYTAWLEQRESNRCSSAVPV